MALALDPTLRPIVDLARRWDELDRLMQQVKARFDARIADLVIEREDLPPREFNARLARIVEERAAAVRDTESQGAHLLAQMRSLVLGTAVATSPPKSDSAVPAGDARSHDEPEPPHDGDDSDDEDDGHEGSPDESDHARSWPASAPAMAMRGLAGFHRPATMKQIASRVAALYGLPLDPVLRRRVRHGIEGLKDRGALHVTQSSGAGRRSTYSLTSNAKADALRETAAGEASSG